MTKNIAILIPTLKAGGAEKQAVLLGSQLAKKCNVHIILLSGETEIAFPNIAEIIENSNINLHKIKGGTLKKLNELKKTLKENNINVLFNYLTKPNFVGSFIARKAGVKQIYNGIRSSRVEWWKLVLEYIAHNYLATGTIYNSYSGEEYFSSKGLKKEKAIVIPNCFSDIADPIVREERDVKHIVTVGRFVPDKDYNTIIRTIAELKELRNDFVIDIIGYGIEEQNIRNWIKEYGVEEYTNMYIRPDNVQEIVCNADIYLSTSLFEGTSNSVMEALNWSLPVVATNVGDNDHLVIDGVNGTLHPIGDAKGMAQAISTLLNSVELRNEYGAKGNQNLRDNYSMDIFEKNYLNIIEQ